MADYVMDLDSLEYDVENGSRASVCHVTGQIYAIAHRGTDSDGYVDTVSIDTDGNVTALDSLEFKDATTIYATKIIHLAGDNYAILYNGAYYARIATVSITSEGVIALIDDQPVDAIQFATNATYPTFIKVSGTTYAFVYKSSDAGDGYITTLSIADNGTVGAVIQTWEFDATTCGYHPDIIHISGDIFAIVYYGGPGSVMLVTVEINGAGAITDPLVSSLEVDTIASTASHPRIINVSGTKYAMVYYGGSVPGCCLATVDIQNDGTIAGTLTDTKAITTYGTIGRKPDIIQYASGVYFITTIGYAAFSYWVRGRQVEIADDGTIGDIRDCHPLSESDVAGVTTSGYFPPIPIKVNGTISIIAYIFSGRASGTYGGVYAGWVVTIGVLAEVTTQDSTAVTTSTATGHGNVTKLGEPIPSQHGHCWSDTDTTPDTGDSKTELGAVAATGAFTSDLTGLSPGTLYYARSYVINGGRTTYGDVVTFTTLAAIAGGLGPGMVELLIGS